MAKTNTIRIFSTQAAIFNHPKDRNTKFTVNSHEFVDAPEWVEDSEMFKSLMFDGKLEIINSKSDIAQIEANNGKLDKNVVAEELLKKASVAPSAPKQDDEDVDDEDKEDEDVDNENTDTDNKDAEEDVDYSTMSNKQLYKLCQEKGIEVEEKKPKDYYLEKLAE